VHGITEVDGLLEVEPELRLGVGAATRRIKEVIDVVARHLPDQGEPGAYDHALVTVATMVGALVLARAVSDRKLSEALREATVKYFDSTGGDQPDAVADVVLKASNAARPNLRYPVGRVAGIRMLRRFAPAGVADTAVRKNLQLDALTASVPAAKVAG